VKGSNIMTTNSAGTTMRRTRRLPRATAKGGAKE